MVYHDDEESGEAELQNPEDGSSGASGGNEARAENAADSEPAPDASHDAESNEGSARDSDHARPEGKRKRLERILPDLLRRAIERGVETGIGTLANSSEAIRGVVNKAEVPREIANYVFSQIDETKNTMVRVVAGEVREFLEAADLAKELQRALTALSFEIRTEIRFKPNDAGDLVPDVKAHVGPTRADRRDRRAQRTRRPSADEDDNR